MGKEIPKANIYTKKGDQGRTQLVDGSCVEKFNPRVEAYGTIDELNSYLGKIRTLLNTPDLPFGHLNEVLEKIQNDLFCVGSLLACESETVFQKLPHLSDTDVTELELEIDAMSADLPPLRNFILPGGHLIAAELHIARTLCRRSERRSAEVLMAHDRYSLYLKYLNRLSDFLFVAARWLQFKMGFNDVLWKARS